MVSSGITSDNLQIGSRTGGDITVDGVTDASSLGLTMLTLIATQPSKLVVFENTPSSFNKGITVRGTGGVVLSVSVTKKNAQSTFSTGTGSLTVVNAKKLCTTGQQLLLTVDDLDLEGTISTGVSAATVECSSAGRVLGVGNTVKEFHMSGNQRKTCYDQECRPGIYI